MIDVGERVHDGETGTGIAYGQNAHQQRQRLVTTAFAQQRGRRRGQERAAIVIAENGSDVSTAASTPSAESCRKMKLTYSIAAASS